MRKIDPEEKARNNRERGKRWRQKNAEKRKAYMAIYEREHREELTRKNREYRHLHLLKHRIYYREWKRKFRRLVIDTYGGKCACCGESNIEFLAIDHVNNNGAEHRRELKMRGGASFYTWLKKQGFPKEGYQVLCHNCNQSKGQYGYCPHQRSAPNYANEVLSKREL